MLNEKHKLAQTTACGRHTSSDTEELVGRPIEQLKQHVSTVLNEARVVPKEVPNFLEAFETTQTFSGPKTH